MGNSINLYRGFVVSSLKEVYNKGFGISNPKWHFIGESNWPGGLSFSRNEAFGLAEQIAEEHGGIPIGGRITINEDVLKEIPVLGIKRILDFSEGMSPGSIDSWRCSTWDDVQRAWEFTINPNYLNPKWLNKLRGEVSTKSGIYVPFNEFKIGIEGNMSFLGRYFRI